MEVDFTMYDILYHGEMYQITFCWILYTLMMSLVYSIYTLYSFLLQF